MNQFKGIVAVWLYMEAFVASSRLQHSKLDELFYLFGLELHI